MSKSVREFSASGTATVRCPRCDVHCLRWQHARWNFWCAICGMDPTVEGPAPPPKELVGLAGIIAAANAGGR